MRKLVSTLAVALLATACLAASAQARYPAQGGFGLNGFDVTFTNADGTPATQAGSHPFAVTTVLRANVDGSGLPEGRVRDLLFTQIPGLVGDSTAYPRCSTLEFLEITSEGINGCPLESAVGISGTAIEAPGTWFSAPVFWLEPPPGAVARLGFRAIIENFVIDVGVSTESPHNLVATARNVPQIADIYANKTQLWGDPSDPRHDELRGPCGSRTVNGLPPGDIEAFQFEGTGKSCPVAPRPKPFLTLPTTCAQPLASAYEAFSWEGPTALDDGRDSDSSLTHDAAGRPEPFAECSKLSFSPTITAQPTSKAAASPTGLDFSLDVKDEGLTSVAGTAQSAIRRVVGILPEGMTANPSIAEGLEVCSEVDLARETLAAAPGEGCPQASKIGTLEVQTPLVDKTISGALYQAAPHANLADDALLAFYVVFKDRELGLLVKQPTRVDPDPRTGQLVATAEEIPQLPFSHFRLHFREGGRSPLVSPPTCGSHQVRALLTPWSGGKTIEATSTFEIVSGPNQGPCPTGGAPPFEPGFEAGTESNAAARHSAMALRLTRRDGDQDLTRFDATLPPGLTAKLAGVSKCADSQIARAKSKSGLAELASPSCPANSQIGTVKGGVGVGSQLTYAGGRLYLSGPFAGAPASVVSIVPAVAGPFDVGTVVVRLALRIDPRTGQASVDGAASDPLPHILEGIPLLVRDIQGMVDRPEFTLNPTSCDPFAIEAQVWGGGSNLFSSADDSPVAREARYQAASCRGLGFAPRIDTRLKGGTRRGAFPALRFTYLPRPGQANLERLSLRFPRSEFIEQGHFRTICTRVQFAAGAGFGANCPKGSIYGRARVFTPLLDEPAEGPVFLRSSDNNLPDAVLALHGPPSLPVKVEVPVRIDSVKGGLRAIASATPDLPVTKAVVKMQGGQKGLFVNSTDICAAKHRVTLSLTAHNAEQKKLRPLLRAQCKKGRAGPGPRRHR